MKISFSGNTVTELNQLHQWASYEGQMEGYPSEEMNRQIIERAVEKAMDLTHCEQAHLVEPMIRADKLPAKVCVARFRGPATEEDALFAHATLLWFQDHFAPVPDPRVVEKIAGLSWTELAENYDF